ncbi:DUF4132 domain-containing protein [Streptomyces sp. NPDC093546]|uniref:DUF4132 domain-containing protein n=1 Tax=Streptomyces sp. NPDC093546 TaxID=3366040 RepID=UPI0037FE382A
MRRDALPDLAAGESEQSFELPAAWRRKLHPRRGGVRRAPGRPDKDAAALLETRLAQDKDWIEEFLAAPGSDVRLVAAARAQLDGSGPSPLGAAAVAAMVAVPPPTAAAWADVWAAAHGLPFAARAAVELFDIEAVWLQSGGTRSDPAVTALDPATRIPYLTEQRRPLADRVRALLAAADEETYRAAVAALADARDGERRRIAVSYLVPSETGWVAACCAEPGALVFRDQYLRSMLFCSLHAPEQADRLGGKADIDWPLSTIATVAEGLGPAAAPLIAEVFDRVYTSAASVRAAAAALVELPGDAALRALLSRAGDKRVRPSLLRAMERRPVTALRVLAEASRGAGGGAEEARRLLGDHVGAHRELATAALPTFDEADAAAVRPFLERPDQVPEAPAEELPKLLTSPPWLTRPGADAQADTAAASAAVVAKVVTGLSADAAPVVEWLPGEREAWAAARSPYLHPTDAGSEGMAVDVEALRRYGLEDLSSAQLFLRGPEEELRPLLAAWAPDDYWEGENTLRPVAARYGTDALPVLTRAAVRHPATLGALLLPFRDAGTARLMAEWTVRLKKAGEVARAWFARHGLAAVPLLVPDAVGAPGPVRRHAAYALRLIGSAHGVEPVCGAAAERYGEEVAEVVRADLAPVADPLRAALPATLPVLPEWADPVGLPQVLLRGGGSALPAESVRHALTMLAMSRPGEAYPGVPVVREVCDRGSLAAFGWELFERWRSAGMPAKDGWALHALGLLGDDETVRRLAPVVRAWPGEGAHHRAVEGLDVLAAIGTDEALTQLHRIAQRVRFKALKERAQERIAAVARGLGLTAEQLGDRLVPDAGLDATGGTVVDYGARRFTVGFDERLRPYVLDGTGKRLKDLPKPGQEDDPERASVERARFTALRKEVRTVAADQVRRLEAAMVAGRTWSAEEFRGLILGHPLLRHLARGLVWLAEHGDAVWSFRVSAGGDRACTDVTGVRRELPAGASVRPAHPLEVEGELAAWRAVFAGHGTLQPFPQLERPVYRLTEEEAAGWRLPRFEGITVPTGGLLGLERRGWRRGEPRDAGVECWLTKEVGPDRYLVVNPRDGIAVGAVDVFPEQPLDAVWLHDRPGDFSPPRDSRLRLGELSPVLASEALADLTALTAGAATP